LGGKIRTEELKSGNDVFPALGRGLAAEGNRHYFGERGEVSCIQVLERRDTIRGKFGGGRKKTVRAGYFKRREGPVELGGGERISEYVRELQPLIKQRLTAKIKTLLLENKIRP